MSVRHQRIRHGWTLSRLAAKCADEGVPVSEAQLNRIEHGVHVPRPELRAVLARLLEMDVIRDFERPPQNGHREEPMGGKRPYPENWQCPSCGHSNAPHDARCTKCGRS